MSKIVFSTTNPVVAQHFAVAPMKKAVPEWYKGIPQHLREGGDGIDAMMHGGILQTNKTVRGCVPVLDYLTSGYVIRSTIHTKIRNGSDTGEGVGLVYVTSDTSMISTHPHGQCPIDIEGERKVYIKFHSPWTIRTPKGYSCLFYQPFYEVLEPRFRLLPAIVDTDTYDKPINFPGFVLGHEEVEVRPGDALMSVFPFMRDAWEAEIKVEAAKPSLFDSFLHGAYRNIFWQRKSYR